MMYLFIIPFLYYFNWLGDDEEVTKTISNDQSCSYSPHNEGTCL